MFTEAQESTYKAGLVRVFQNCKVIGAGLYIDNGYVLTCAHVVTQSLNLGKKPQSIAVESVADKPVKVDFPFIANGQFCKAEPVPELWRFHDQDLAVLKLLEEIPRGVFPSSFQDSTHYRENHYHVYGFPEGHPEGIWARGEFLGELTKGWIQMEDTKAQGLAIEPGFSGAPVWNEALGAIAGMTVARDKDREEAKVGFMIPYEKLKSVIEAIALFELLLPDADQLADHWQRAYQFIKPELQLEFSTKPDPSTLQDAILKAQDIAGQGSDYRAIEQFIGYLALPTLGLGIQPRLLQWLDGQGVDTPALLQEVQQKLAEQSARHAIGRVAHLLFWVQAELNSDRYFAQAYLIRDYEHYDPDTPTGVKQLKDFAELFEAEDDEKISSFQLEHALQRCLNESVLEIDQEQDDFPLLQVDVFLPRRCLGWNVDQWLSDEKTIYNLKPDPIGSRYTVVLRSSDRLNNRLCTPQLKIRWRKKWKSLEMSQDNLVTQKLTSGDRKDLDTLIDDLSSDDIVGWHKRQPPQSVPESDPCPFSVLVGAGSTVALWLRQSVANSEHDFSDLLGSRFSELPTRVFNLRKDAHDRHDKNSPHIGETIGLMWEDPKLVPPAAATSRLRMSA
ncbi:MAG: trypsin-like peptidase domain-containing protein [Elainellaceae cyanobacterium]